MYVISERINGMFKAVKKAIAEKDAKAIQEMAKKQVELGSDALDLNVGTAAEDPAAAMVWLVETVQEVTDKTLCLDNPKLEVLKAGAEACKNDILINSTTAKDPALGKFMAFAAEKEASIIGLTLDEKGVPNTAEHRVEIAAKIITAAMEHGIPMDKLYIDPITLPVNVAQDQPQKMLKAIEQFTMLSDPAPHIVIGLSNLSQRCKEISLLNSTFLAMCIGAGLDAAILDPHDEQLMNTMITAEVLMNQAIYSDDYLKAYKA